MLLLLTPSSHIKCMPQSLGESSILTHLHLVIRLTMSYKTHLTVLQHSAAVYSSSPAFLLPRLDTNDSNVIVAWDSISYQQFLLDVERSARHWSHTLTAHEVPRRSVVGLWSVQSTSTGCNDLRLTISIPQAWWHQIPRCPSCLRACKGRVYPAAIFPSAPKPRRRLRTPSPCRSPSIDL